jgi:hypothetical protein
MKYAIFLFAFISVLFISCESEKKTTASPDLSVEPVYLEPGYFGICFGGLLINDTVGFVIKKNQQYQALGDTCRRLWMNSVKCDTANLPEIDFANYSLIGIYTDGGGCSVTKEYDLEIDTLNYTYIYFIHRHYEGMCDMLIMDMNWALVPAIPENYEVEFRILGE